MKEIEIPWNGGMASVTLRKPKYKDTLRIRKKCRTFRTVNGIPTPEIDEEKLAIESFKTCIVKAPFEVTDQTILEMDSNIAEIIENEINKLGQLDLGKKNEPDFGGEDRVQPEAGSSPANDTAGTG